MPSMPLRLRRARAGSMMIGLVVLLLSGLFGMHVVVAAAVPASIPVTGVSTAVVPASPTQHGAIGHGAAFGAVAWASGADPAPVEDGHCAGCCTVSTDGSACTLDRPHTVNPAVPGPPVLGPAVRAVTSPTGGALGPGRAAPPPPSLSALGISRT